MRCPRGRARQLIGPGLLVPILVVPSLVDAPLVAPAPVAHAQTKPARPQAASAPKPPASAKPAAAGAKSAVAAKAATCAYTVRSGDSLSRIAARHHVSRAALLGANHVANPNALRVGQRLRVPGCHAASMSRAGGTGGADAMTAPPVAADGSVIKRVGPRRVLTALVLAEPDFQGERIPLVWPAEGPVISTFGQRRGGGWHAGIDISAEIGSQVFAAAPGTVSYSGWIRSYGYAVKIQHSSGFITLYAHNLKNLVEEGEEVEAGQVIATVGRSGHATGPHVHFEVQRDGKAYNPLHLLEPSDLSPIFEGDVAASSSVFDPHE